MKTNIAAHVKYGQLYYKKNKTKKTVLNHEKVWYFINEINI